MSIEVYAFEDREGNSITDWTTQNINEAREFAIHNHCRLIARIFEYADSELVETYAENDPVPGDRTNPPPLCPHPSRFASCCVREAKEKR